MVRLAVLAVAFYVGSYLALSRPAFAEARSVPACGFYFFPPRDTVAWRFSNYGCVVTYSPIIALDVGLGTGLPPG